MAFSDLAQIIFRERLCRPGESPEQALERVAGAVSVPGLFDLMMEGRFFPNSPAIRNLGDPEMPGYPMACNVIPIEDSIVGIMDAAQLAARIQQAGGGTGFCFSTIRPAGSMVRSTKGVASGPVSFLRIFDVVTDTIKQGSQRRGANMATFSIYHPDVIEFITAKRDRSKFTNFNFSVLVDRQFMEAVRDDLYICQRFDPSGHPDGDARKTAISDVVDGNCIRHIRARELFDLIVANAHEHGEPGLLFIDRAQSRNPVPHRYRYRATNPCGEQFLGPYESCVLGSINLAAYAENGRLDWLRLGRDIPICVEALDRMIDVARYPDPRVEEATKRTRRIGLGVMGWADLLWRLEIPYSSDGAIDLARELGRFIRGLALEASKERGTRFGPYPDYNGTGISRRNAALTCVAPTGTLSILAGCSSGIEPVFALAYARRHAIVQTSELYPELVRYARKIGVDPSVFLSGSFMRPHWMQTAHDVSAEWHVRHQAAWQSAFADNAVSKTINFPSHASRDDVARAYWMAYELGCLGITVYRDGSRPEQVLTPSCSDESCAMPVEVSTR